MTDVERAHRLVWVDLQTNAKDAGEGDLTCIALVVTNENLDIVAHGPELQIGAQTTLLAAEDRLLAFLAEHCDPRSAPLCGDTVWKDKQTLVRCMPRVMAFLHYRIVDVATLRQLAALWYSELPVQQAPSQTPHPGTSHAAIGTAIAELRRYRNELFIPSGTRE